MSIELRPYQQAAVDAALASLSAGNKPVISLPTGSGKSLVLAAICAARPGRSLVLSHRKELLEQDCAALNRYAPRLSSGIYSAGLSRRDTDQQVIFGGVQSVYRKLPALQEAGDFDTILIDEAHATSRVGNGVMYDNVLSALPDCALVGLTATPYRLDSGMLHEGDGAWFNDLCIHVKPSELIPEYLSSLVGVGADHSIDTEHVHVRNGDYITSELSQVACNGELVANAVNEILKYADGRKCGIIFSVDVEHARMIFAALKAKGEQVAIVTGQSNADERSATIQAHKAGELRWLVNCAVLTTGYDAPGIDCVAVMRPTLSKALFVQMCGRGMRKAPGKQDCLLLDFGTNVERHGSLDLLASYKPSKAQEEKEKGWKCDEKSIHKARERQYRHAVRAFAGDPMAAKQKDAHTLTVNKVTYAVRPARKLAAAKNLVAYYDCGPVQVTQWICLEYGGTPRWHAEQWFARRGMLAPRAATLGLKAAKAAPTPHAVTVRFDAGFQGRPVIVIEHFDQADEVMDEAA